MSKSKQQLAAHRERIRVFLAAVQAGASDTSAAAEAGISRETLYRWKHGERPFDAIMRQSVARAHAIRERRWLDSVQQAGTDRTVGQGRSQRFIPADWRATAWMLERTNPEFAPRTKTEVSGPGGAPISTVNVQEVLATPDVDRLGKVVELLQSAGAMPLLEGGDSNGNGHGSNGNGSS